MLRILATPVIASALVALAQGQGASPIEGAQAVSQAEEDRESRQADYSAKGLPLGSFRLFPTLGLGAAYDDNVFRTETGTVSDTYFLIIPALQLNSNWERHELKIDVGAEFREFSSQSSESTTDWHARAAGRLDITRPLRLFLEAGYEQHHEPRGAADEPGNAAEPTVYQTTPISLKFDYLLNRLDVRASAQYVRYDWDSTDLVGGGSIDNSDRDRYDLTSTLQLLYEFSPGYRAYLSASHLTRNHDLDLDRFFQNRDVEGNFVDAGVSFELSSLLVGDLFLGYSNYKFSDPSFSDVDAFDFGAGLKWYPTQLTTVSVKGRRWLNASTLFGVSGILTTEFSADVDHELLRNLIVSADLAYVNEDFEGSDRNDDSYHSRLAADYLLNRYSSMSLYYEYTTRDSNAPFQSYDSNVVGILATGKL